MKHTAVDEGPMRGPFQQLHYVKQTFLSFFLHIHTKTYAHNLGEARALKNAETAAYDVQELKVGLIFKHDHDDFWAALAGLIGNMYHTSVCQVIINMYHTSVSRRAAHIEKHGRYRGRSPVFCFFS
jgi:hypothetical protein